MKTNTWGHRLVIATAATLGIFILAGGVAFTYMFMPGVIRRPIAFLHCGHKPVIAHTGFYGEKEYFLPDNEFYGTADTNFLSSGSKYFCSEEKAKSAGYKKQLSVEETRDKVIEEEKRNQELQLSLAKSISYQTYTPDYLPGSLKKSGFEYDEIKGAATGQRTGTITRQRTEPPKIWIEQFDARIFKPEAMCEYSPCQPFDRDAKGRQIVAGRGVNTKNYHYGLRIDNTLVGIVSKEELPRDQVLSIMNSLRPTMAAEREVISE